MIMSFYAFNDCLVISQVKLGIGAIFMSKRTYENTIIVTFYQPLNVLREIAVCKTRKT